MSTDLDLLFAELMDDPEVRTSAFENDLRRCLARAFEEARARKKLSIRALAKEMGSSVSQVQRVLHREVGGSLTLRTMVRAADALDLTLDVRARPRSCRRTDEGCPPNVLWFPKNGGWSDVDVDVVSARVRARPSIPAVPSGEWSDELGLRRGG